jgi:hypothetical protein
LAEEEATVKRISYLNVEILKAPDICISWETEGIYETFGLETAVTGDHLGD